jgi:Ca2+-binding EF-hand superfamily protein
MTNQSFAQFQVRAQKDQGSFEDFMECLKLYDKQENGTMLLAELEHSLKALGELLIRLI